MTVDRAGSIVGRTFQVMLLVAVFLYAHWTVGALGLVLWLKFEVLWYRYDKLADLARILHRMTELQKLEQRKPPPPPPNSPVIHRGRKTEVH